MSIIKTWHCPKNELKVLQTALAPGPDKPGVENWPHPYLTTWVTLSKLHDLSSVS